MLKEENRALRSALQDVGIDPPPESIVPLPAVVKTGKTAQNMLSAHEYLMLESLRNSRACFVILDSSSENNSIVFASDNFFHVYKFTPENEVMAKRSTCLRALALTWIRWKR